jgi:hypothetical protein
VQFVPLSLLLGAALILFAIGGVVLFFRLRRPAHPAPTPLPLPLPPGATALSLPGAIRSLTTTDGRGRLTLLLVGTYGVRVGGRVIDHYRRTGCLDAIGAVIAIEFSADQRAAFLAQLPSVLAARTEFCESTLLVGGLHGASVDEVEAPRLAKYWKQAVDVTIENGCRLIRGTEQLVYDPTTPRLPHGYDPSVILVIASPGGHLAIGIYASHLLQTNFPEAKTYITSVLSDNEQLRAQFPEGLARYEAAQFVRWYLMTDDLCNPVLNDWAVATWWAGIWAVPAHNDLSDDPENVLRWLGTDRSGVVVPRLWSRMLPVQHTAEEQPQYFTFAEACVRAVFDGLAAIEHEQTKAIPLPTAEPKTRRYVLISLPLVDSFLRQVKDTVEASLAATGYFAADRNRKLLWTSTAEPLTPATGSVRMAVVAMEAACNGVENLAALALGQPLVVPQSLPASATGHRNGTHGAPESDTFVGAEV